MDFLIEQAVSNLMNKETVFFGLFLVGYYLQIQDKREQKGFIKEQQKVLIRLTRSVEKIEQRSEKQDSRLDRIENKLFDN